MRTAPMVPSFEVPARVVRSAAMSGLRQPIRRVLGIVRSAPSRLGASSSERDTTPDQGSIRTRWLRLALFALTVLILIVAAFVAVAKFSAFASRGLVGIDLSLVSELGRRWAETGSQYAAFQLDGPYPYDQGAGTTDVAQMPGLYPPLAGPLFAVVRLLPPILWWAPLLVIPAVLARWRPAPWAWPLLAACLAWPNTTSSIVAGNTAMWVAVFVTGGLNVGWPAALTLLKPTFAPLALIGVRSRSWYLVVAAMALGTLLMAQELARYLTVIQHQRGSSPLYSVGDVPMMLIPIIGYLARSERSRRNSTHPEE